MTILELLQILVYFALLIVITPLLGGYIAKAINDKPTWLTQRLKPIEVGIYRISGINIHTEQSWGEYAITLIVFNIVGFFFLFVLQLIQAYLPLNPANLPNVEATLAFNTATSFMSNTNWQSYAGETTLSYLTQMLGLTVQNFVSAGTGMAVLFALTRSLMRKSASTVGNFWGDLVRSTIYVLLPLSIALALVLVSQGVIQNFSDPITVTTLTGESQLLPQGPAASQIAIKQIGSNGGGYFNANSAHPYENPTPLSNFFQMFALLLIPAALTSTYGQMVGSKRHGWALFIAMMLMLVFSLTVMLVLEYGFNSLLGTTQLMEGKETRFGITNSVLWASVTTAVSNGSIIAAHSSLSPLAGGMAMLNIMLGEVIFGGVGAGLYGMLIFVILTVFIAGLMVGRTPEYLGKKIEAFEIKMAILAILLPSATILIFSSIAVLVDAGLSSRANMGPHGFSEILYAFTSAAGNNGSAFAGLNANTPFYNLSLGISMWIGRFGVILPALAIAGSMVRKKIAPPSSGTLPTDSALFVVMLISVIVIVGALTFFPALALGPIIEQLLLHAGRAF